MLNKVGFLCYLGLVGSNSSSTLILFWSHFNRCHNHIQANTHLTSTHHMVKMIFLQYVRITWHDNRSKKL